jgi:hypothetical protein
MVAQNTSADFSNLKRKLITFNSTESDSVQEGVLVDVSENTEGQPTLKSLRILHADGLVRKWQCSEIRDPNVVHSDAFSEEDVSFKLKRSLYRGGSQRGRKSRGKALEGEMIDVWSEEARDWQKACKVVKDSGDELRVQHPDGRVEELNDMHMWKLHDENPDDALLSPGEVTLMEEPMINCCITKEADNATVNVYKMLASREWPGLRVTKNFITIAERLTGEDKPSQVYVIEPPVACDTSKPIDAIVDDNKWLQITYTCLDV